MNPKKHKELLKEYILEKNLDQQFTEDLIAYYWKTVRQTLTLVKCNRVTLLGLGIFEVKFKRLVKEYARVRYHSKGKYRNPNDYHRLAAAREQLQRYDQALERHRKEEEKRIQTLERRKEYELKKTLESQKPDPGRDPQ